WQPQQHAETIHVVMMLHRNIGRERARRQLILEAAHMSDGEIRRHLAMHKKDNDASWSYYVFSDEFNRRNLTENELWHDSKEAYKLHCKVGFAAHKNVEDLRPNETEISHGRGQWQSRSRLFDSGAVASSVG